jgi:hypothetical protein
MTDIIIKNTVDLKEIKRLAVRGYRWHSRSNGNTYHSVVVSALVDNAWVRLGSSHGDYGYERQYEVTAVSVLKECVIGWNPKEKSLHYIADELGLELENDVFDVSTKREMINV